MLFALLLAAQASPPVPAIIPPPVYNAQGQWQPDLGYIKAGQDEPGYRSWYLAMPSRAAEVRGFNDYLAQAQVGGVIPTWELIRTASSWRDCGAQPFEVPPTAEWPNIVQTLRYIRDQVVPAIGPVEAVSTYRNPALNVCAGGAPDSAHKHYSAIDMVPLRPTTREELMKTLCAVHARTGEPYRAGLGFYAFIRFHIDTMKFRRWNMDPAVLALCPPLVHAEDAGSVGQPIAPVAAPTPAATSPTERGNAS
jgi:hypothetical protein